MANKKQFAVLGLGRFGSNVALTLEFMGCDVLGVDWDENVVEDLAEDLAHVVSFDIKDEKALMQAGISNCDTVVIASSNLESSLMATMLCKELNIAEIVVKAIDERHAEMARRLGATQIIFPERDTGRRVALHLVSNNAVDYIDIAGDIKVLSLIAPKNLIGKNLIQANLRGLYNVNVIAVTHSKKILSRRRRILLRKATKFFDGKSAALAEFKESIQIKKTVSQID